MNLILYFYNRSRIRTRQNKIDKQFDNNFDKQKTDYFDFDLISKYFKNVIDSKSHYYVVSDKVKNDLDIDELFSFIDRTASKIGQQFLYSKLRIIDSIDNLEQFEKLVNVFENQINKSRERQKELSKLNNSEAYYLEELIHRKQIEKPKWINLIYVLSIASILSIILSFFNPIFLLLTLTIFIVNLIFHYLNKAKLNYYLTAVSEFYKSIKIAKTFEKDKEIKEYFKDLSFLKKIYKIQNRTKFITFEKQLTSNEFAAIVWSIFELLKILFNIEIILFYSFIDSIIREKENIAELFCFLGKIDAAISVSNLRSDTLTTCKPEFTKNKNIDIDNIIHPLIKNCVPNSLKLKDKSLLLTGSNMSGKTTFIRTVSINSILAQTINTCFAEKYKAPFFKIFSSIRISDNLFENTSYFLEEVLTIKEFIEESKKKETCLFVLDEIFKGTNTAERIAAGNSILSYLNKNNHIIFVSTHDIELTDLLEKDNYHLCHFQEEIMNNELIFGHKLKHGKLKTKNAVRILELYNYPEEIINNAKTTL